MVRSIEYTTFLNQKQQLVDILEAAILQTLKDMESQIMGISWFSSHADVSAEDLDLAA